MRYLPLLLLVPVSLLLLRCASLRPFSEVRKSLPEERFLQVGDQLVHIEQAGSGEPRPADPRLRRLHLLLAPRDARPREVLSGRGDRPQRFRLHAAPAGFCELHPRGAGGADPEVMDALGMENAHSHGPLLRRRNHSLDRLRATRSGCARWCWSTAPPPPTQRPAQPRRLPEAAHGALPAPRRAATPAAYARRWRGPSTTTRWSPPRWSRSTSSGSGSRAWSDAYHGLTAPVRTPPRPVVLEQIKAPP